MHTQSIQDEQRECYSKRVHGKLHWHKANQRYLLFENHIYHLRVCTLVFEKGLEWELRAASETVLEKLLVLEKAEMVLD